MQPHQGRSIPICNHSIILWIIPLGDNPPNPISVKAGSAKVLDKTASDSVSNVVDVGTGGGAGISMNSWQNKNYVVRNVYELLKTKNSNYMNLLSCWRLLLQQQLKFHSLVLHSLNKMKGSAVLDYNISH